MSRLNFKRGQMSRSNCFFNLKIVFERVLYCPVRIQTVTLMKFKRSNGTFFKLQPNAHLSLEKQYYGVAKGIAVVKSKSYGLQQKPLFQVDLEV